VKRIAAERARLEARASGQNDHHEMLRLADDEVSAAKLEAQTSLELAINADVEKEQAIAELRQIKASYMALQGRLNAMQVHALAPLTPEPLPGTLDDIEAWARENLSGEVEIHEKAVKAARNSNFQNVELVYQALLALRDLYVPMRRQGGIEKKRAFELRLAELGLENKPCFAQENKAKSFGDTYFVRYQGAKHELDWHLKGSSSRDGRLGFRLYYFWDADTSRVVVGYFPGHLENDGT
jgi:hypothetical protein